MNNTLDFEAISAFGDLLEQAQERLDHNIGQLEEEDAERELRCLDKLWAHYQELLG